MRVDPLYYAPIATAFGPMSIVWRETERAPRVHQVYLPQGQQLAETAVLRACPDAQRLTCPAIVELGERVQSFLEGGAIKFPLDMVALEHCGEFQRSVLMAEYGIPRGWVSTYGRIAAHLGVDRGARAVGRALAENPFPILIPCHRAVKADGGLGGYQGGLAMKRALLELEGVRFTETGKVCLRQVYY